jgi:hypothetical protein
LRPLIPQLTPLFHNYLTTWVEETDPQELRKRIEWVRDIVIPCLLEDEPGGTKNVSTDTDQQ